MKIEYPQIQTDVPGPDGQAGFLLIVPRDEVLDWDIRDEIVSTSRHWVQDRQAWWVAAAYLHTAEEIVRRFSPPDAAWTLPAPPPARPAPVAAEAERPAGWRGVLRALRAGWGGAASRLRRRWGRRASPGASDLRSATPAAGPASQEA